MPTKKIKKEKSISISDVDHPLRRVAIDIIECAIEPLLERGINGKKYYQLEDEITNILNRRIGTKLVKPLKADLGESLKVIKKQEEDEDNDNDYDDDDDHYSDDDGDNDS